MSPSLQFIRRIVIIAAIWLSVAGGCGSAAVAAVEYGHGRSVLEVTVELGSAFGAWLVAALLGLYVEIADSLVTLVEASSVTGTPEMT